MLRSQLHGRLTFGEYLEQVKHTTLGAYDYQDIPFDQLVNVLRPDRSLAHAPLFQVLVGYQNTPREDLALPGLKLSALERTGAEAKFGPELVHVSSGWCDSGWDAVSHGTL